MNFAEFASTQDVTPNHPMIDIIDAAMDFFELKREASSFPSYQDWVEAGEDYANRVASRYADELDESLAE